MCYAKSVNFIEFLMDFSISDDILVTVLIIDKKLLHFKPSQLGQILYICVNTGFSQACHKYRFITLQSQFHSTAILIVRYVATEHFVGIKAVATYCPPQYKCMRKPKPCF